MAAKRFAGEWIHPEGARVLSERGLLDRLDSRVESSGFVVCPNDGLGPIRLDYPDGAKGFTCEHERLVSHLRDRVARGRRVDYLEGVRALPVDGRTADLVSRTRGAVRVSADRVVVAAGRSSGGAGWEALRSRDRVQISSMAGLLVTGAALPIDGFGHVILGGPGPVLAYRIDDHRIRLCFDVPHGAPRNTRSASWIWDSFADVLPPGLRDGVRDALATTSVSWAANAFRPRSYRTESGVALVGDAAGIFHPLTAMGITTSLLDAEALASTSDLDAYSRARAEQSYIPELLSNAIYQAFARSDAGSEAIRESIFRSWRASPSHCGRTMSLLGASSTSRTDFVRAFARVAALAGANTLATDRRAFAELAGWLRWPWASVHPQPSTVRSRSLSWAAPHTWARSDFFRLPEPLPEPLKEKRHGN
jgi:2-polyprenyl-6-methoxyphenol hydroxylase-like FAD-dependent oxidoreductase